MLGATSQLVIFELQRWSRTHKEVVGVGDISADSEELHQVMELPMDIAAYLFFAHQHVFDVLEGLDAANAYCYRRCHRNDVALLDQELPRLVADFANLGLGDRATCPQLSDSTRYRG